ncbi:MAG: type 3 dihydrofolate reductase [Anaplasmataceae bacterium]|nr:type 3 dihydrofolate reductase [Anaplasmataceae bacterium]
MRTISIIAAIGKNRELGLKNSLLWHLPDDLKRFKQLTLGHPVLMGRKTYESIGKPLPQRTNIIISRSLDYSAPGCTVAKSIAEALEKTGKDEEVFVIGGEEIYKQVIPNANRMYLTCVDIETEADAFFPEFQEEEWDRALEEHHPADEKHPHAFTFKILERR